MTAYVWKTNVSADWSAGGDWLPSGPPDAATADATIAANGVYTVAIGAADSELVDSLTFDPASASLNLSGTLTLGGTLAAMTESSGTVNISGTLAGGTLAVTGGVLNDTGAGVISSATDLYGGGTITVASGKMLTLSGPVTLDSGAEIDGPGTLATTGSTSIIGAPNLDGSLVWDNSGTVSAGVEINVGYPSETGTVKISNQAGGAFDLTADGQAFYVYGSGLTLSNAGVLAKTGGTGTSNITVALTNTGTLTATTGVLELDGGGTLGGTVTETATGAVTLGEGLFALTGTVNGAGTLTVESSATLSIGTSETIATAVVLQPGTVTIASGKTLTLSGPVTMDGDYIEGPGTLATTGATTVTVIPYVGGSLVWNNTGTVSAGAQIYTGFPYDTGNITINNQTGGAFDLTADGVAFYVYQGSTLALNNAGVLSKTGGTGTSNISAALTNTGTVTATSGTLELDGGGTLSGVMGATGAGALALGEGTFTLGGTAQTISGALLLDGGALDIASGQTLTLSGSVTMDGSNIDGPGTLVTTGATDVTYQTFLDASLVWVNSGTVTVANAGDAFYVSYPSYAGTVTVDNLAGGVFDLTAASSEAFYSPSGIPAIFSNAGLLEGTSSSTVNFGAILNSTGSVLAGAGDLDLSAGGTLGGSISITVGAELTFGGGTFEVTGGLTNNGTLEFLSGSASFAAAHETIADQVLLDGGLLDIASGQTLTLSGSVTMDGSNIDGPGTLVTTGATDVTYQTFLDASLAWVNSGTVTVANAGDAFYVSYPSYAGTVTVDNLAGGVFDLTAASQVFTSPSGIPAIFSNAGLLEGTSSSTVNFGAILNSTGSVLAGAGDLDLTGGGTLGGSISIAAGAELTLGGGTFEVTGILTNKGTFELNSGTLDIAADQTVTLSGSVTMDGSEIDGPGTLLTTGATDVTYQTFLDASLVWVNSGTVTVANAGDAFYVSYPSYAGTVTVDNLAGGVFDLTAASQVFTSPSGIPAIFSNAGLLEGTSSSTVNFGAILNSTGSVLAGSGDLDLTSGGTLGGSISIAAGAELTFGGGTFEVTGSLTKNGTLEFAGGSASFAAAHETIGGQVLLDGGTLDIGAGQTVTLSGSVTMDGSEIDGPGTLLTTGATDITAQTFLDASLVWVNSGTVTVANAGNAFYVSYPSYAGTVTVDNLAGGVFDLTAASQVFTSPSGIPAIFSNAGLLEGTSSSTVNFGAILNSTGSVLAGAGDLDLTGGGTLGGSISIAAGAELTLGGGTFEVTGILTNKGTFELNSGTLDIAAGQTVTLSGSVTMDGSEIDGPGTLLTTGATDITAQTFLDASLVWVNSGTVTVADSAGYPFYVSYPSYAGTVTVDNLVGGVFDLTAASAQVFYSPAGIPAIFSNAGLLQQNAGTGINDFDAALNNTGTITATSGTLDLDGGGTLNGSIGGTGAGVVLLDGTGGNFVTTGTLAILDAGTANDLHLINGVTLTDNGVIDDSGHFWIGNNNGTTTLVIAAGASFDFTANDGEFINGGGVSFSNAGILAKIGGTGTSAVGIAFTNTGTVDAASGTLRLAGGVSGTGRLQIEAGDTLELGSGSVAGNNTVDFNGLGATLKIDTNSTVTKSIIGLGGGSRIDLAAASSVAAVINGNTLTITPTGGSALNFVSTGSLANLHITTGSDGGTGTVVTLYNEAAASAYTPAPVAFGDVHANANVKQALTVTNTAPPGGYTENLDAALTSSATGFTATGSFTGLIGGASNTTALTVTLDTVNAGTIAGIGTLTLDSDGSGVDGFGTTALATQTVVVSGTIFNYATASAATPDPVNFGERHVGATLSQALSLTNLGTVDGFTEKLDASIGNTTGSATAGGSFTGLAAGASNGNSLTIGLISAHDGAQSGTATIALTSDGAGVDTLGTTALAAQTITVEGTLYNYATASVASPSPVNFGEKHVGATLSQTLSITNLGTADGFTEKLDASIGSATGPASASGSFSGLAAGVTNSSSLTVDLNSGTAGVQSGTATIALTSDGSGVDTLGTTALTAQTITVEGTLYNYATASAVSPNPVNFGIVHVGTAVSDTLSISNLATAGSFSEKLDGSVGGATGGVTTSGSFTGLAASATNTTSLAVGLNTSNAGTISGMATITLASDGAGVDTLGTTVLAAQTVVVSGIVNNYATATIEKISGSGTLTQAGTAYTLALGTIDLGAATPEINLGVINAATGPADLLGGSFTVSGDGGGAFINTLTAFSSIAAGNLASGDEVSLSSSSAGAFSETITLLANGSNSSGYLGALPEEVVTVTGSVAAVPRTLIWTGAGDTNFANAFNWDDTTSGLDPATLAPTTLDTAQFNNGGDSITGTGTAAVLLFDGGGIWQLASGASLTASGSVTVGSALPTALLIDQGSSLIDTGSAVIANTTTASGSSITVSGIGSDLDVMATLAVGKLASGTLDIASGATVSALDVTIGNASALVSVGAGSELLIGTGGELTVNGTLANFGAVSGGGATEVAFGSGTDRLIVGPDATFGGAVVGGGIHSTLELAAGADAGTLNALGTNFTNFGTVTVDAGATWTVDAAASLLATTTFIGDGASSTLVLSGAGTFSLANVSNFGTIDLPAGNNTVTVTDKTLSGGAVTINDGASGNNTVSAASDTSASKGKSLTYVTGSGTDSFAGGFENDTVDVSAAALGGDSLTGGSGSNTLVLTSAGVLSFSNATKFQTIDLAAGNSTVTVTDAMLSGGSLKINDGASGNNTVSAAGDTSASTGKTLTYNAGSGTDSFTGGFETDTVNVSAAAAGGDTLTGGSGTNTLNLTSAGTANLGGVSKFHTINLAAGNNTVTVTDTTLSGGTVLLYDGASGNDTVSAAGDTSASKGKALNYFTGAGTDSFTGGFENDSVHVSAAAVGGDTLTGGSGANTLFLTSAGSANLGGVSKFGTVDLFAGNNTVTVTDTTLSGGTVVLNDGSSGNDTVSTSETAASKGRALNYFTGAGTDKFTGGFENDTVHVSAAAVGGDTLTGGVGTNVLILTSAGTVNLAGVSKFAAIDLAAGNSTVTVTDTTLSGGALTINDGASGNNTVSAASDTSASKAKTLTYFTGPGTDSFTGGFETDFVHVSASAVGGDTLTGGSGGNTLMLSSAGTANLGGVSKFATIELAAGNNTVTVTDTTLSGPLQVTIYDAASGNNTVSAAGDTSASTGKTLNYFTDNATDKFTGGFENDAVRVTAAAVGGDTLTGGSGSNTLVLTTAGTVNLGGVSKFHTINLQAGNNTVTVTDTTLSGGTVVLSDGPSGNNTISAASDTSASKGKALNYYAGAGTDSFTGGFENDSVHVSAAALAGDTLTGGSGANTLFLNSAGTFNLGNVSKFGTVDLFAANNAVTLTDTTLSIGTLVLNDGASGNNTVSAATDTSASQGKTLNYFTGPGTDKFTGGFENDTLHVSAAAVGGDTLTGGSGANALLLTSAGTANLGGVSKFGTIDLAAGNSTVTLTDTTLSGGTVVLNDGASGNDTVSAASDTSASKGKVLNYFTGPGTDGFTGGFENDTVHVSAAAVGGDVLTGGSGTNTLVLTSAGTVNLGGVSKFGTINLAAGNNTVTVTDTTLSGGSVTINAGSTGNDTVSAAGDTSASAGKTLTFYAGSGTNGFTGGAENDTIYAGTGSGSFTAGSGSDTFVFIKSSLPSQTLNNFQVSADDILVYGTHSSGGFDLGSTDNALNPTTPTAISVADFVANASGDFTSSSQRFAYDTSNGQLFYSATGSNASESLIATLAGAPGITAGNFLFEH